MFFNTHSLLLFKYFFFLFILLYFLGEYFFEKNFSIKLTILITFFFIFICLMLLIGKESIINLYPYVFSKKINTLSKALIISSIILSTFCYYLSTIKIKFNLNILKLTLILFNFFLICFLNSNNIITFFFFYELLLLLSVILVNFDGINKRSVFISLYFLFWTQLGSFLLLIAVFSLYYTYGIYYFYSNTFSYIRINKLILFLLLCGFCIKLPSAPFHFWLTKTHVEATTSFSIFLSGILVKIALFGFYKFLFFINQLNLILLVTLFIFSMFDVTIKLLNQVDLKKIVAYATIFEMNLLSLAILFYSKNNLSIIIYFAIFHSFISGLFFFLVDVIYKITNTRIISNCSLHNSNNFYFLIIIFISLLLFSGIPLSIKFTLELKLITVVTFYNFFLGLFLAFLLFFFNFTFLKIFLLLFFGKNTKNQNLSATKKDITIALLFILLILILYFI